MKTLTSSAPFELYPGFASFRNQTADENMFFLMLLANLIACLELNLALCNLILVFHRRITSVIRALALSRSSHHNAGAETPYRGSRRFWIPPVRTSAWCDHFVSRTVLFQNREMPKISQSPIFRACTYRLTYDTACHSAFSSVLVWTVENAAKTVVWGSVDADRSMRFR